MKCETIMDVWKASLPHVKTPDLGFVVALRGAAGRYVASFEGQAAKDSAKKRARELANEIRETVDVVQVQERGGLRHIVAMIEPEGW